MINPELINYIKQVRSAGHLDETIKQHLLTHGYTKETVEEAFNSPSLWQAVPARQPIPAQPQTKIIKKGRSIPLKALLMALTGCIVVALGAMLILHLLNTTPNAESNLCEGISVKIHELYELPVICAFPDNSKLQMILKNDGNADLGYVEIHATSERGSTVQKLDKIKIAPGDVLTLVINVDQNKGKIKEVTISPGIKQENGPAICQDESFSVTDIRTC